MRMSARALLCFKFFSHYFHVLKSSNGMLTFITQFPRSIDSDVSCTHIFNSTKVLCFSLHTIRTVYVANWTQEIHKKIPYAFFNDGKSIWAAKSRWQKRSNNLEWQINVYQQRRNLVFMFVGRIWQEIFQVQDTMPAKDVLQSECSYNAKPCTKQEHKCS